MALLKGKRLPFGLSCCYTSQNTDVIGSEEYFDQMIAWGAKFCWLFTYMPVGRDAVPELMVSAEQRKFMYEQVRKFRETKPIFTLDFWNDGEYAGGCIAGGRRYLHINANGDMDPCAFIHYSDSNIRVQYQDGAVDSRNNGKSANSRRKGASMSKKVFVLLTQFPDLGSKALRFFTGAYFSHASIGLGEDKNIFCSFVYKGFIVEVITRYLRSDSPVICRNVSPIRPGGSSLRNLGVKHPVSFIYRIA